MLDRLVGIFGRGQVYVELQRHGTAAERQTEAALIELAYSKHVPLVATNEAFFSDADMYEAHDALLCIAQGLPIAEPKRRRLTPDHRFKSAEEMRALYIALARTTLPAYDVHGRSTIVRLGWDELERRFGRA